MMKRELISGFTRLVLVIMTCASGDALLAADAGIRGPASRAGLFFEEPWQMAQPGEHPLTQADVVNPKL
jgi:hypothetical protein